MIRHKFRVGQLVYCLSRESVSGLYEVTGLLPREGDVFQYRIKNAKEPHERWSRNTNSEARSKLQRPRLQSLGMDFDYRTPAELFLSKRTDGGRTKYRRFATAAEDAGWG